ncbi:peptidyl-prolyl cis-trans isomerase NIMA-interacting 1 [Fonticula alba]|uniref:Peptidyl-prolyl cis-trans isomerase n=1 Tax=Fonticula alba TaxID=691883 RepID=A0A058Z2B4_FONAL|nr:peptidyl-prolyl cis-trans isomerase NIMA-interacting 1 [Fonticula alba]KCV68058.1 peptidyl-prolyl cis-trans isomerase NIMA-interacting 1 [Fonticula alba]|eukprot:XP_009497625.1 peptidyl-prolyl cis-trans isomerase NIMA-interacting 1 [Fonticula alba]
MSAPQDAPPGWAVIASSSRPGKYYYLNKATGATQWEYPTQAAAAAAAAAAAGPAQPAAAKVRASHLLVKHRDSRRPSSWKESVITRSKEEALDLIRYYQKEITEGRATLATLATTESDCSSASRGGDLGFFGPGDMQQAFEVATYKLSVGEISDPIFTDSGIHLIQRTA